jgi:hypothetical protein
MSVVLQFQTARPASDRAHQLDTQVIRLQVQLGALIDHIVAEALFVWLGNHETSPTDEQIAAERDHLHSHYTRVALAATEGRRSQP